jgi:hypothetical protein
VAAMKRRRFQEKLSAARAGGAQSPAARALFTAGGCHAWAMAAASEWDRVMRYSSVVLYSDEAGRHVEADCYHAWCDTGAQVADAFGFAPTADDLMTRFVIALQHHPTICPTRAVVRESHTLSADQVRAVLARTEELPVKFYGEPEWLAETVKLAREVLPHWPQGRFGISS